MPFEQHTLAKCVRFTFIRATLLTTQLYCVKCIEITLWFAAVTRLLTKLPTAWLSNIKEVEFQLVTHPEI